MQHRVLIRGFYKGKLAKNEPKIGKFQNLVTTFDWEVQLTQGQHVGTAFCKTFSGIPPLTIFDALKYALKYGQIRPNTPNTVFGARI